MNVEPEIEALVREERSARSADELGPCSVCGSVVGVGIVAGRVYCYQHRRGAATALELDHIAGAANLPDLKMLMPGNAHRRVTEIRLSVGAGGWPAAGGDPLLQAAHLIVGLASIAVVIAEWLVALSRHLASQHALGWWSGAPNFPLS
jgi:hypothetical protein